MADNHFSLFGLPACFDIEADQLEQAWRAAAIRVHPDAYATASPAERRVAVQWAARVNDAYRQLHNPLLRARYLCELAGIDLQTETNTTMDSAFLLQQIAWRERLQQAGDDTCARAALQTELQDARTQMYRKLADLLDVHQDYAQAGIKVREWMFLEKFAQELALS